VLGRRIEKKDLVAGQTTRYYYSSSWQVLDEYDDSGSFQRLYVYGNYIDEVLLMQAAGSNYYYVHDHLYSPAALVDSSGTVVERYEYDIYGRCSILDADFTVDADQVSDFNNPYYFTARRLDVLDSGNLRVYYYRYRYYDDYSGRFMTHDPLGINPAGDIENPLEILTQYTDGLNLFEYCTSNPVMYMDKWGLRGDCCHGKVKRRYIYVIIKKKPTKILFYYYSGPQPDACACGDCCDRADKMFKKDAGGWKWLLGRKKRLQICNTKCFTGNNSAFYYY